MLRREELHLPQPVIEQHLTLRIEGMDCADCALKLEKGVHTLDGVTECTVSFATARMNLVYDPALVEMSQVARRVRAMGYRVAAGGQPASANRGGWLERLRSRPRDAMTLLSGLLLLLAAAASLPQPVWCACQSRWSQRCWASRS